MLNFGIQIMKTGEAFNTRYLPIMWNENAGPVEVNPYEPGDFTVYTNGQQAMFIMQQLSGYGVRLVSLPSTQFPANNNSSRTSSRTSILEYQIRDTQSASNRGPTNRFYNKFTGQFEEISFGSTRGDSSIRYTNAKNIRDLIGGELGGTYELIQQISPE